MHQYIDAFAGTGYRTLKQNANQPELLLPELAEQETQDFLQGSARIALEVQPRFHRYIFIEKDSKRCTELEKLRTDYPSAANDVLILNGEANASLRQICRNTDWRKRRAVLFLDPFGMQVEWNTIATIAATRAIDMWMLFPLGVGVNRLLRKDNNIDPTHRARLDTVFGTSDWHESFYETATVVNLFGVEEQTRKISSFKAIEQYFVNRLRTVFADVADNPLWLYNSKNNPLYLLVFAASNPRGAPIAIRIAEHILGRTKQRG